MTSLDNIFKLQFYRKKATWKLSRVQEEVNAEDVAETEQNDPLPIEQEVEDENNNVALMETILVPSRSPDLPEDIEIFCGAEEALNASTAFLNIHNNIPVTSSDESWSFMLDAADVAHSSPIPDECEGRALRLKIYNKTKELKHLVDLAYEEEKKRLAFLPPDPELLLSQYPKKHVTFQLTGQPETHLQGPHVWYSRGRPPLMSRANCRGIGRGRNFIL